MRIKNHKEKCDEIGEYENDSLHITNNQNQMWNEINHEYGDDDRYKPTVQIELSTTRKSTEN